MSSLMSQNVQRVAVVAQDRIGLFAVEQDSGPAVRDAAEQYKCGVTLVLRVPEALSTVLRTTASCTTVLLSRPSAASPKRVKAQAEKEVALCVCCVVLTPGLQETTVCRGKWLPCVCVCVYNVRVIGMYYVVARLGQTQDIRLDEPIPSQNICSKSKRLVCQPK